MESILQNISKDLNDTIIYICIEQENQVEQENQAPPLNSGI